MGRYTGKVRNLMIPVATRDALKQLSYKYQTPMGRLVTELVTTMYKQEFGEDFKDAK